MDLSLSRSRLARATLLAGLLIAMPSALVLNITTVESFVPRYMIVFLLPGMIAAMALAQNVHAFSPTLTILFSLLFWTIVTYAVLAITSGWHRRSKGQRPGTYQPRPKA